MRRRRTLQAQKSQPPKGGLQNKRTDRHSQVDERWIRTVVLMRRRRTLQAGITTTKHNHQRGACMKRQTNRHSQIDIMYTDQQVTHTHTPRMKTFFYCVVGVAFKRRNHNHQRGACKKRQTDRHSHGDKVWMKTVVLMHRAYPSSGLTLHPLYLYLYIYIYVCVYIYIYINN